jgi:hypothetical protein
MTAIPMNRKTPRKITLKFVCERKIRKIADIKINFTIIKMSTKGKRNIHEVYCPAEENLKKRQCKDSCKDLIQTVEYLTRTNKEITEKVMFLHQTVTILQKNQNIFLREREITRTQHCSYIS